MRAWGIGVAVAVVGATLGCGGAFREVYAEGVSGMTVLLDDTVPQGAPRRAEVRHLIDQGFVAAWEGHVGLVELLPFQVALEEAVADGAIQANELALLKEQGASFDDHPVDPERWAELMVLKTAIDDRVRRQAPRRIPSGPPPAGPADWALPEDLERRLAAAGFAVERCVDEPLEAHRRVTCRGQDELRSAIVTVAMFERAEDAVAAPERAEEARVDRDTVLTVEVLDGAASRSLRDELFGAAGRPGPESVRRDLEALGWSDVRCSVTPSGVGACTANRQQQTALVRLEEPVPDLASGRRVQDGGVALIRQGAGRVAVRVGDHEAAVALADDLTGD